MSIRKRMSWTKLAEELGKMEEGKKMDVRALKLSCKGIMKELDACTVKKKIQDFKPSPTRNYFKTLRLSVT